MNIVNSSSLSPYEIKRLLADHKQLTILTIAGEQLSHRNRGKLARYLSNQKKHLSLFLQGGTSTTSKIVEKVYQERDKNFSFYFVFGDYLLQTSLKKLESIDSPLSSGPKVFIDYNNSPDTAQKKVCELFDCKCENDQKCDNFHIGDIHDLLSSLPLILSCDEQKVIFLPSREDKAEDIINLIVENSENPQTIYFLIQLDNRILVLGLSFPRSISITMKNIDQEDELSHAEAVALSKGN